MKNTVFSHCLARFREWSFPKWRNYLQGVWRRHQHKPEVAALYQSKLIIAEQLLQIQLPALAGARHHPYSTPPLAR